MPIVTVEKPLKDKLGDEAVDALVRLINQSQGEQENNVVEFVGDKFERRLTEEIAQVNVNIFEVEKRFDSRLSEEIAKVRVELAATRADLLKWMLIFSIGQVGVIVGLVLLFFK